MAYTQFAGYATIAIGILYALLETKRLGAKTFVIRIYTLVDYALVLLKLSKARQPFVVGFTKISEDDCFMKLISLGYQWDYLAFIDSGEIISMRILDGETQTHCRVYIDGTIGMHLEPNYEFDPIGHLKNPPLMPSPVRIAAVLAALAPTPQEAKV